VHYLVEGLDNAGRRSGDLGGRHCPRLEPGRQVCPRSAAMSKLAFGKGNSFGSRVGLSCPGSDAGTPSSAALAPSRAGSHRVVVLLPLCRGRARSSGARAGTPPLVVGAAPTAARAAPGRGTTALHGAAACTRSRRWRIAERSLCRSALVVARDRGGRSRFARRNSSKPIPDHRFRCLGGLSATGDPALSGEFRSISAHSKTLFCPHLFGTTRNPSMEPRA
jgi:hypothetical protein